MTMDLEIAPDHDLAAQREVLDTLRDDLARLGLPITVFTTAVAAEDFAEPLRRWPDAGHEIGSHGVHHGPSEDYCRLPAPAVEALVSDATRRITTITGTAPRVFRGPRMTTSAATQDALVRHGYVADLSICPQRLDMWSCAGATPMGLRAPRRPYQPSVRDPNRRGGRPLTVVPLSGAGVPFVSGSLFLFGRAAARALFTAACAEARLTGAPIVFLFHSYEQTPYAGGRRRPPHQRLYRGGPAARRHRLLELFRHMLATPRLTPRTVTGWLEACA